MSDYEDLLAQQPKSTTAGNVTHARLFVERINAALIQKTAGFTDSQRNYLYKLRDRWMRRAEGKDENWNQHGSAPGRRKGSGPKTAKSAGLDPTVFGDEDEIDPLLASLQRKYGTPRRTDDI